MAGAVTVVRDTSSTARTFSAPGGRRMYLYTESGKLALAVDIAPRKIQYSGLEHEWSQADRSGNTPLLLHKGTPLDTMQFEFMVTDKIEMLLSQQDTLTKLRQIAHDGERVLVRYSSAEAGLWRITSADYSSELREPNNNEISRAMVSVTLTRASDAAPSVGPVSKPAPPPPPKPKSKSLPSRTYIIVKGDTLWAIARKFYGASSGPIWPKIFDANRKIIKNPSLIFAGQKIIIP